MTGKGAWLDDPCGLLRFTRVRFFPLRCFARHGTVTGDEVREGREGARRRGSNDPSACQPVASLILISMSVSRCAARWNGLVLSTGASKIYDVRFEPVRGQVKP